MLGVLCCNIAGGGKWMGGERGVDEGGCGDSGGAGARLEVVGE